MDTKIIPKKSVLLGAVPPSGSLGLGEIAINHADKKLYAKHPSTGAVQEIGGTVVHSHDELYSADLTKRIELQNDGTIVSTGATTKTFTLPSASGTLATLDDITAGQQADWSATSGTAQILNKPTLGTAAAASTADFAATSHQHSLSDLTQSSATTGQVVAWNGTAWAPSTPAASGVSSVAGRTGAVTLSVTDVTNAVGSVTTGIANTTPITNMMQITQSGYNALGASVSPNTLYIIVG